MPCYHPLKGYRSREVNESGKRGIVFNPSRGYIDQSVTVPCGQCVGCRLERSRQWAIRCAHEASLHEANCFITLTYNDSFLPRDRSLNLDHFQRFMKRLRKRFGSGIRFYHCGEYGEQYGRPHYHACLFNFDFPDRKLWKVNNGHRLYTSEILSELWPFGYSSIGDVTFESAAYVARYIMKKVTGDMAEDHYTWVDPETGEVHKLKPEYTTMSRRPGIGKDWLDKYKEDVFPGDFVVMNGKKMKPPKFYDRQYELDSPDDFKKIKRQRISSSKKHVDNNTPDRLRVRERVQLSRLEKLPRPLD
jgi:hypothetical protein